MSQCCRVLFYRVTPATVLRIKIETERSDALIEIIASATRERALLGL